VLGLFAFLAYRGFKIALASPDSFGTLLACGVTCCLIFQAVVNIGVVTASFPFTGIPLPFISFGGSSIVISLASVGILLSVSRRTMPEHLAKKESTDAAHHLGRGYRGTRLPSLSYRTRPKTAGRTA
jgi:cell division protein FtsW